LLPTNRICLSDHECGFQIVKRILNISFHVRDVFLMSLINELKTFMMRILNATPILNIFCKSTFMIQEENFKWFSHEAVKALKACSTLRGQVKSSVKLAPDVLTNACLMIPLLADSKLVIRSL
jgi:hypothetical protein